MSTTTFQASSAYAPATAKPAATPSERGFFSRLLTAVIAARQEQAAVAVASHLSRMSDDRLAEMGFSAQQIAELRLKGRFPASYWD